MLTSQTVASIEHPTEQSALEVKDLCKTYTRSGGGRGSSLSIKAVDLVSFALPTGSSIAFVGGSGSGKSTLAMCLCRLVEPDSGSVRFFGTDFLRLRGAQLRYARSRIHMVFQDSATAFNPGFTAEEIICEPMAVRGSVPAAAQAARARQLIARVGMTEDSLHRSPMQFSGGQRQRLAIARALAADAALIIFDESLSGLDMPVQAEIATLLLSIQRDNALSYIFISHDIELAACLAAQIAVMKDGRIVERGPSSQVLHSPGDPYTRELVSAMLPLGVQP